MKNIKKALKLYIDNNLVIDENARFKYDYMEDACFDKEPTNFGKRALSKSISIDDYIENHKDYSDFQTMLFNLIDEKGLKDSDVYNKVHIDRRLFSKIRSDKNYHPSKETILLLALALELSEEKLDKLLDSASYSLPKNNKYDLIIRFCFINKIFKISDINELLNDYNCKLFNY